MVQFSPIMWYPYRVQYTVFLMFDPAPGGSIHCPRSCPKPDRGVFRNLNMADDICIMRDPCAWHTQFCPLAKMLMIFPQTLCSNGAQHSPDQVVGLGAGVRPQR